MAGAGAAGSGDAASVLVVGADADGVAPSLLLTCNRGSKRQYLFGCAEGFSRLALEHRVRPTGKLRACFLTSFHPDACGGLGGTLLRLSGDGHGDLLVAGPSGVGAHIRALRRFVRFRHPQVTALRLVPPASVIDAAANPDDDHVAQTYEDDSIRVFPLYPRVQCQLCEAEAEAKRKRKRREDGAEEEDDEAPNKPPPLNTPGTSPVNYFLGYAVSVKGTSDDEPGPTFLVLDCGDSDAAMDAGRHPTVECCLLGKHRCAAVFHVSDVRTHPTYDVCTWSRLDDNASLRDKWASMCQNKYRGLNPREFLPLHVMCRVPNEVGFRAGARTLARLECVYRWAFPTPLTHHTPYKPPATPPKMPPVPLPPRIDGSLCTRVRLRVGGIRDWGFGLVESNGIAEADQTTERPEELDIETVQGETRRLMEDASIAEVEDKKFDGKREAQNFPELVFLGTGSAEPSRYRGSSAILIKRAGHLRGTTSEGSVLLDAGEGCAGAMKRYLGNHEAHMAIWDLKVLWVSHQHPDHMLGVRGVLALRQHQKPGYTPDVLTIVGPRSLKEWLEESPNPPGGARPWRFVHSASVYAQGFGGGPFRTPQSFSQRPPPPPPPPPPLPPLEAQRQAAGANWWCNLCQRQGHWRGNCPNATPAQTVATEAGLARFEALPVRHCPEAAAIVIGGESGWQLAYSGDCRPSVELTRLAHGVDVLIHEATFDDSRADHAERKRHSTTSEALWMARACGEKTAAVLTHFSQRYPRSAVANEEGVETPVTAFDGMRCRLDKVGALRESMRGINRMFEWYERARDVTIDDDDEAGAVTLEPEVEEAEEEERVEA